MDDDQQFCLRWNNHQSTLVSVFDTLLEKGIHVDCTLAAEGQTLKAHKVVLSACSPYFENVLSQQYDKHPIIILKDVKYAELRAMMDYMYRGEVNISQDQLAALLKAAESLQIKGLSDNKPSRPPSRPAQAVTAHPPRATSPPPQVARDGSIDSREGSISPTRRRKKARRMSTEGTPVPVLQPPIIEPPVQGNGDDQAQCKEEIPRDGVEDLTLDEEAEEQPPVGHNDVVRNFQWHMERSQDEIMNSNDSARESQDSKPPVPRLIVTSNKDMTVDEPSKTFAILKNVKTTKVVPEDNKEDAKPPPDEKDSKCKVLSSRDSDSDVPCAINKTEKGYKCLKCPRYYNARRNLMRHIRLECGREPQYKCPYCAYSKHRRNELKNHIKKKHPNVPQANK